MARVPDMAAAIGDSLGHPGRLPPHRRGSTSARSRSPATCPDPTPAAASSRQPCQRARRSDPRAHPGALPDLAGREEHALEDPRAEVAARVGRRRPDRAAARRPRQRARATTRPSSLASARTSRRAATSSSSPRGRATTSRTSLALKSGAGRMLGRAREEPRCRDLTFQAVALEFDEREVFRSRSLVLFGPVRARRRHARRGSREGDHRRDPGTISPSCSSRDRRGRSASSSSASPRCSRRTRTTHRSRS